ncbi:MAG: PLP-dependent transferase [Bacteroidales bacterium]|jgi:O-acetylhomoserine (thiol)-lyase|nr:PLP-dependent transferase [Bacteroidales bacterium]MDD4770055.1 PLP-dependent transferase [Bacteroidales bacterium]HKL93444.1 PLP-dependent transferase [Bacteroidales bacterium]
MQYQHSPYQKPDPYQALQVPIYPSIAFEFDSAESMSEAFTGKTDAHFYSRISNPTVRFYEERVRNITGAMQVTAVHTGMAAISHCLLTLAGKGGNLVSSPHLFGNSHSFLQNTLRELGVEVRFCDLTNPEEVSAQIDSKTCALFLEVLTNPQLEIAPLRLLSQLAHKKGVPVIADTTLIPFCAWKAVDFGVDIEVISSTKYLSGGGTSLGGLIVDYGRFDWTHSPVLGKWCKQENKQGFDIRLHKEILRNLGGYMSPQAAYTHVIGMETLELRFRQSATTCKRLALELQQTKGVRAVGYTGLPDNPFHKLSSEMFGPLPGSMFTLDLEDRQTCFRFLNKLKTIKRATNLFDNKSLALHPASTIYGSYSDELRQQMGIRPETLRFSIGLEPYEDLLQDIQQSLSAL